MIMQAGAADDDDDDDDDDAPGSFAAGERNASSYALANMSASFEI